MEISDKHKKLLWDKLTQGANGDVDRISFRAFIAQAEAMDLDPMAGHITPTLRWNKDLGMQVVTPVTTIDGYRSLAARTGAYAGGPAPTYDEGLTQYEHITAGRDGITTCTATVRRVIGSGIVETAHTIAWAEYYDKRSYMWRDNAYMMMSKTAEAGALRKAFPDVVRRVYTDDEMQIAGIETVDGLTPGMEVAPVEPETEPDAQAQDEAEAKPHELEELWADLNLWLDSADDVLTPEQQTAATEKAQARGDDVPALRMYVRDVKRRIKHMREIFYAEEDTMAA